MVTTAAGFSTARGNEEDLIEQFKNRKEKNRLSSRQKRPLKKILWPLDSNS
jgi:hypothetical protein